MRLRLPHDNTDPTLAYSMPDPEAYRGAYEELYDRVWYRQTGETVTVPTDLVRRVLLLANGYMALTLDADVTTCVKRLRDVWRALRPRRRGGG